MTTAISVQGVGKRYFLRTGEDGHKHRLSFRGGRSFWALREVSFDVPQGRAVGMVGANGAGKSTLLRLIAGVGRPDEGRVATSGHLSAILELGAGFHPELTGRESTILAGIIAGLTRRAIRRRLDDIVSFAELERFIDDPVRTYSSGMTSRLAFAIATSVDPEILLVDELLAVGDLAFQERCLERIEAFRRSGVTLLLVSHHPNQLATMCDEVVWVNAGRLVTRGSPQEVTQRYEAAMADKGRRLTPDDTPEARTPEGVALRVRENRFGTQEAQITSVRLADEHGHAAVAVRSGGAVSVEIVTDVPSGFGDIRIGVRLVREDGVVCVDTSTKLPADPRNRCRTARLDLQRLDLLPGRYAFDVGLYSDDWDRPYDFHWRAYGLRIVGDAGGSGVLAAPLRWSGRGGSEDRVPSAEDRSPSPGAGAADETP